MRKTKSFLTVRMKQQMHCPVEKAPGAMLLGVRKEFDNLIGESGSVNSTS
ncbi:hypothetical protein [Photobacterium sp. R1]